VPAGSVAGSVAAGGVVVARSVVAASVSLGAVALLVVSVASGLHAAWTVRRMRARAEVVAALDHTLDLSGGSPPRRLVMLGDSAAAGHGLGGAEEAVPGRVARALVALDGRATVVRSVAVDGATTDDVLQTQVQTARGADVVLLGVGANDAFRVGRSCSEIADTTHHLLIAIREVAAPDARIVFHTCPDLSMAPGLPMLLRPVVGWRCRRVAEAQHAVAAIHGVAVADLPRELLSREVFGADRFHPGALGHARLAERVVSILAGCVAAPPGAAV
jgi:lysophospholipase L1-like esterase